MGPLILMALLVFVTVFVFTKGATKRWMSPTSQALASACATLSPDPQPGVGVFDNATFGIYPATATPTVPGDAARVRQHNTMRSQGLLGVLEMKWHGGTAAAPTPTVALARRPARMWSALQWGTETLLGKQWVDLPQMPAALFVR